MAIDNKFLENNLISKYGTAGNDWGTKFDSVFLTKLEQISPAVSTLKVANYVQNMPNLSEWTYKSGMTSTTLQNYIFENSQNSQH